jgi:hypothetical protein
LIELSSAMIVASTIVPFRQPRALALQNLADNGKNLFTRLSR